MLLELLLIGGAHHRSNARIAEKIPAGVVRVAAVVGVAERALMRVVQDHREERGGAAGEPGRSAGFDVGQHRIPIGRREIGERLAARRPRISIERGEA